MGPSGAISEQDFVDSRQTSAKQDSSWHLYLAACHKMRLTFVFGAMFSFALQLLFSGVQPSACVVAAFLIFAGWLYILIYSPPPSPTSEPLLEPPAPAYPVPGTAVPAPTAPNAPPTAINPPAPTPSPKPKPRAWRPLQFRDLPRNIAMNTKWFDDYYPEEDDPFYKYLPPPPA